MLRCICCCAVLLATSFFTSYLYAESSIEFENSSQFAVELDDNVFKTFVTSSSDGLLRLLYKNRMVAMFDKTDLTTNLQIGGKKHFSFAEQDTVIAQGEFDFSQPLSERLVLSLEGEVKGQYENQKLDGGGADINEDLISLDGALDLSIKWLNKLYQSLYIESGYLAFFGDLQIDFFDKRFGTDFRYQWGKGFSTKLGYQASVTTFTNSPLGDRKDTSHEILSQMSFYGPLLIATGYSYEENNSSQNFFSSSAHKVNLLVAAAFFSSDAAKNRGEEDLTFNLLGNVQIRTYPTVFISDDEGQRLLFSNSEDNNFNSVTLKITKRLNSTFTGEFKYSRNSNEFSDREDKFARNRYLLGIRASF